MRIPNLCGYGVVTGCVLSGLIGTAEANQVLDWNRALIDAFRADGMNPPAAAVNMAMLDVAMYDAVNAATGQAYKPVLAYSGPAAAGASAEAAAFWAGYGVISNMFQGAPAGVTSIVNSAYATGLAALGSGPAVDLGKTVGQTQAANWLAVRQNDGRNQPTFGVWNGNTAVTSWQPTPPDFTAPLLPNWGSVTPFVMTSGNEFRPPAPPAPGTPAWQKAYDQVMSLGGQDSTTRTPGQTQIALLWSDMANTMTAPGRFLDIVDQLATSANLDTLQAARLSAMLSAAEADAGIAVWEAKYVYDTIRPVTVANSPNLAADAGVAAHPGWMPLLITTPDFPEYVSGHSAFGGAGAAVLEAFFGSDATSFTVGMDPGSGNTYCPLPAPMQGYCPVAPLHYASFEQAALDDAASRVYGGVHFEFSDNQGLATGRQIADFVLNNAFAAVPEPSALSVLAAGAAALAMARRRRATHEAAPGEGARHVQRL